MIPIPRKNPTISIYDDDGILTYEAVYQLYHQGLTPIRIVGTDFSILAHNPAMNSLCQVLDPQIIGKRCYEIARSDTLCNTDECPVRLILNGEREVVQHFECILWNGTSFPATCRATPFFNEKGEIIGIIEAITDQSDLMAFSKSLEKKNRELEHRLKELELGYEISKILNEEVEIEAMAQRVLEALVEFLPILSGAFYVVSHDDGETLVGVHGIGLTHTPPPIGCKEGLFGEVFKRKEAYFLEDVPPDYMKLKSGLFEAKRLHLVFLPFTIKENRLGMLELSSLKSLKPYGPFFKGLCGQLAVAIQNAFFIERLKGLQQELQEKNERLQAQNEELQAQSEELMAQTEEIQAQAEELAAQKDALEQKSIEAEEANRMKSVFLSNMSHELRTPLNSILGLVRLLKEDQEHPLSPRQQEYLDIVLRNGQNLLDLINDILDLTRIESGREELHYDIIYVPDFVTGVCKAMLPLAESKGLEFKCDIDHAPKTIYSDSKKVRQILVNLLGNAIKFTESGMVLLKVDGVEGKDRDFIRFTVSDTGIGIPEDALEFIFEPFRQVDGSYTRKYGGTGLGLSICKKLSTLLGGEISVESEVGKGTTFKVLIPVDRRSKYRMPDEEWKKRLKNTLLYPQESASPGEDAPKEVDDRQSSKRVLLVDDDLLVGKEVSTALKQAGFEVLYCSNPLVGLKVLREQLPDIVLLDLKMPVMDGFAFLREMTRDDATRDIPVLVLSSLDVDSDTKRLFPPNVKSILQKGNIRQEDLKNQINALLLPKEIMDRAKREAGGKGDATDEGERRPKILVAEDNPDNFFLLNEMLRPRGFEIIHASNGKEAVELALKERPDLILMDIQMPEMDGISATREIRIKSSSPPPIIALTAKAMKGDREFILNSGLDDYISKPFDTNDLFSILEKWL